MMIKSIALVFLSLFVFASLADISSGNETALHHKSRRNHKKDAKLEYYLNRHVEHPDVDAEAIQKHGASLEDAKMQADGLDEPKNKKSKLSEAVGITGEETEAKLQEMGHHHDEERQHQRRRHHRHEAKVHEEKKSDEPTKKEVIKEKKMIKNRKTLESVSVKSEEVKVKVDDTIDAESKHSADGKRNHDKRKKGHKHSPSGHKNKKHAGKKSHKQLGKPSKDKKDKKMRKNNHQN